MKVDFEREEMSLESETVKINFANRVLDMLQGDPKSRTAWKFWHASHPTDFGDCLRFRVRGSKHDGYVTIRYLASGTMKDSKKYNAQFLKFDIDFGVLDGTAYKKVHHIADVQHQQLVQRISEYVI